MERGSRGGWEVAEDANSKSGRIWGSRNWPGLNFAGPWMSLVGSEPGAGVESGSDLALTQCEAVPRRGYTDSKATHCPCIISAWAMIHSGPLRSGSGVKDKWLEPVYVVARDWHRAEAPHSLAGRMGSVSTVSKP